MVINMDKTCVYFDIVPTKTVNRKGTKTVKIQTTGSEKPHITVMLARTAVGKLIPPMIIFKRKQPLKLNAPTGYVIVAVQEKAWMD